MYIGISDRYTVIANKAVGEHLSQHHEKGGKKMKRYTAFSDEQRAEIGRYAAVNVKQELELPFSLLMVLSLQFHLPTIHLQTWMTNYNSGSGHCTIHCVYS